VHTRVRPGCTAACLGNSPKRPYAPAHPSIVLPCTSQNEIGSINLPAAIYPAVSLRRAGYICTQHASYCTGANSQVRVRVCTCGRAGGRAAELAETGEWETPLPPAGAPSSRVHAGGHAGVRHTCDKVHASVCACACM
jgi:hypothetical protein